MKLTHNPLLLKICEEELRASLQAGPTDIETVALRVVERAPISFQLLGRQLVTREIDKICKRELKRSTRCR
jgi:hypothetical protein